MHCCFWANFIFAKNGHADIVQKAILFNAIIYMIYFDRWT
jgi:hypothetical protein